MNSTRHILTRERSTVAGDKPIPWQGSVAYHVPPSVADVETAYRDGRRDCLLWLRGLDVAEMRRALYGDGE